MIKAKEPAKNFLEQFFTPSLFTSRGYHIDTPHAEIKLDQNESPWDWPEHVKDSILAKLKSAPWNRYPPAFADELAGKIAKLIDVDPSNVLLGPGSNYLIALVLQTFAKKIKGKIVLARPSFALYESHCQYEGIEYEPWPLNQDLEYDVSLLPDLPKGSLVLFASPNNPVGNILTKSTLKQLLTKYPDTMFIGDEAYCEFGDEPYTDLLGEFPNLMLIRTFSKTLGAAGLRLGYIVAGANVIELLKKPRVPFLINQFTLVAAGEVLTNPEMARIFDDIVKNAISERKRVCAALEKDQSRLGFKIKSSQANFLLARWPNNDDSNRVYKHLIKEGILVRNVSAAPGLAGCLRISIGTSHENDRLIAAFLSA
jgi:histidinol-phosphate aminotransferase